MYCHFCFADQYESIEKIKTIVDSFVKKTISVDSGDSVKIQLSQDTPSQLPLCTKTIEANLPVDTNPEQMTSVELSCNGVNAWHALIPVNVQVYTKVVIAKHPLSPNESISDDDLDYSQADKMRLYTGYFKDKNDVIGLVSSQMIAPGAVLSKKNLQKPVLVHRNEMVDLTAGNGSIVVTLKGISKMDGRLNETIRASNPATNKVLDAIVVGPGKANIIS